MNNRRKHRHGTENMGSHKTILQQVCSFYLEGFRNMPWWGRRMWLIIFIKLFIIFAVLKLFFFPDFLKSRFSTERERSEYVMDQLINPPQ